MLTIDVLTIVLVGALILLNILVLDFATSSIDDQEDSMDDCDNLADADSGIKNHSA